MCLWVTLPPPDPEAVLISFCGSQDPDSTALCMFTCFTLPLSIRIQPIRKSRRTDPLFLILEVLEQ